VSITTWNRLEPRTRSALLTTVKARLHDPLWLVARQWQLGELQASDAGSPWLASLAARSSRVDRYATGHTPIAGAAADYTGSVPLETQVEAETDATPAGGRWLSAQAGHAFLRMLGPEQRGKYAAAYRARYANPTIEDAERDGLDAAATRRLELVVARVPDGAGLYADLAPALSQSPPTLPAEPQIAGPDHGTVLTVAQRWLRWYEALRPHTQAQAWQPQRLEHAFALGAPDPRAPNGTANDLVLSAARYRGGHLDWHAFDVNGASTLGSTGTTHAERTHVAPTRVRFPGMPKPRFWELEDSSVNLGALEAAPEDLGRLLVIEYSLVYGNDFFAIPVDLPLGSIFVVERLQVRTTFADEVTVPPIEDVDATQGTASRWSLFRLSDAENARPALTFLAPALGPPLNGEDLETVPLSRDEAANVAWIREDRIEGPAGLPVITGPPATTDAPAPEASATQLAYHLQTPLPVQWHPLVATIDPTAGVLLRRQGLREIRARVLAGVEEHGLAEEELPRAGLVLKRAWQRARWHDGSTHIWIARRRQVGGGESATGLRHDDLQPG
jgi:hypothetical protein